MAIAIDAHSTKIDTTNTDFSWSHTCTGSDRTLVVALAGLSAASNNGTIGSVTYNSVAMTQGEFKRNNSGEVIYIFYLLNPATGSNTIAVSSMSGDADRWHCGATSFTGTGVVLDQNNNNATTGTQVASLGTAITTVGNNTYIFGACASKRQSNNSYTVTGGSGQALHANLISQQGVEYMGITTSTEQKVTAGAETTTFNFSINCVATVAVIGIKEKPEFTVSDTLSMSESSSSLRGRTFSATDTLSLSEAVTTVRGLIFTVTDTLNLTDALKSFFTKWTRIVKNTTSWTNKSENSTSYTEQSKNSTSWTNKNQS